MLEIATQWLSNFHLTPLEVQAAGVVMTLSAVLVAFRTARRADKRWERDRDDRQKAHARLVTLSWDMGTATEPTSEMVITNNSPEAILMAGIADVRPRPEGTVVAGRVQLGVSDEPIIGVIRPLAAAEFYVHCLDAEGNRVPWPEGRRRVTIEFMDAHGKSWRRVNYDEPELIERVKWAPR